MSEIEPIRSGPRVAGHPSNLVSFTRPDRAAEGSRTAQVTAFDRSELMAILAVYGRKVAAGEWRDYAIDLGAETATFSVFRRASECPLFRIQKTPSDARRQGAYRVVAATGLVMKRGRELARVLGVLEPARVVD